MRKWEWDWMMEQKFEAICKEFGGKFFDDEKQNARKEDDGLQINPLHCQLTDFDDFKAFTHWMNKQTDTGKNISLHADYRYDTDYDHIFTADFYVLRNQNTFEKTLNLTMKKSISDAEGLNEHIREELNEESDAQTERMLNNWTEDFINTKNETKEIIDTIKKPYLKQYASIDTYFSGTDDHWYTEAEIQIPIEKHSDYPSILQDSDDTLTELVRKADDIFYDKLNKEVQRLKGARP